MKIEVLERQDIMPIIVSTKAMKNETELQGTVKEFLKLKKKPKVVGISTGKIIRLLC